MGPGGYNARYAEWVKQRFQIYATCVRGVQAAGQGAAGQSSLFLKIFKNR